MTDELKNTDPEDIEDLLVKVETSFGISFAENELAHIKTFGELSDYVTNKIQLDKSKDCTTQQAFYKLRNVVADTFRLDNKSLSPKTELVKIFPQKNRKAWEKQLEQQLDLKLHLLRPPNWVTWTLTITLITSFFVIFFYWQAGLFGLVFSILGFKIAIKLENELDFQTLGQLAEKMTRDNYLKSRRNPKTFNKREIENVLTNLFVHDLSLDRHLLTREATFV